MKLGKLNRLSYNIKQRVPKFSIGTRCCFYIVSCFWVGFIFFAFPIQIIFFAEISPPVTLQKQYSEKNTPSTSLLFSQMADICASAALYSPYLQSTDEYFPCNQTDNLVSKTFRLTPIRTTAPLSQVKAVSSPLNLWIFV